MLKHLKRIFNPEKCIRDFFKENNVTCSPNPKNGIVESSEYDIVVKDKKMFKKMFYQGNVGIGETYMDGQWDCEDMLSYGCWFGNILLIYFLGYILYNVLNMQTKTAAKVVAKKHYNYSNEHFEQLLDPHMQYTCGYFARGAQNLNEAQVDKLNLIAEKVQLKEGMRCLDIGCGWGNLLKYFAKNYKADCVGVTISKEQAEYARKLNEDEENVKILLLDYRNIDEKEKFDVITAVGVTEHIGVKNYCKYFKKIQSLLKKDGLALIQTIGTRTTSNTRSYSFISRYIFPHGMLPSNVHLSKNIEKSGMIIEDWHNFGNDYYHTLLGWMDNLAKIKEDHVAKHGKKSYRKWMFYLGSCAAEFKARRVHLWQLVLSKNGLKNGYKSIR